MCLFATISRETLGSMECPRQWIQEKGINRSQSEVGHSCSFNMN